MPADSTIAISRRAVTFCIEPASIVFLIRLSSTI